MEFTDEENTRMQPYLIEHNRPMLLKDFLRDRDGKSVAKKPHIVLLRSWSKRAAATKMSAVHRVVKLLQFASSRSSRKLTKRGSNDIFGDAPETMAKVKVKDILRWRSFRDLADDDPAPLEYSPPSSDRSAATTTTTTSCSKSSSWCDSDFTAEEELPPWGGENINDQEFWGKIKNNNAAASFEEDDQQSPVSVLASPFRQVEEFISPHRQTLAFNEFAGSTKRSTATRRCDQERNFDKASEEKARQLLRHLKRDADAEFDENVMLDFFIHEVSSMNGKLNDDDEFDGKTLRAAKSWMDGELEESYEWEVEERRESFVKDMEKGFCWNKFEQEQQDLTRQLELWLFNYLIDDLVADFIIN